MMASSYSILRSRAHNLLLSSSWSSSCATRQSAWRLLASTATNGGGAGTLSNRGNSSRTTATTHRTMSTSSDAAAAAPGGDCLFDKIAFLGGGKMAQAVIEPLIKSGIQSADKIHVYDVHTATLEYTRDHYKIQTANSVAHALDEADLVVCCVKPQNLTPDFFAQVRKATTKASTTAQDNNSDNDTNNDHAILLSIIAGKTISVFREGGFSKIVRSMPNTPAMIGEGMTVWSCTPSLTSDERKKIGKVLSSFGNSMYVDDESYIDMATSISGSGPAYIFLLMESMIDAGVHMGFPRDQATKLVYQTMLGSTLYAMETKVHPAILRNMVTSPSGTTASAIYELENGKFRTVIKDAMWACYRRSLEMGDHDSNVGPGRTHTPEPKFVFTQAEHVENDGADDDHLTERIVLNIKKKDE